MIFEKWKPHPDDFTKMVYSEKGDTNPRRIACAANKVGGRLLTSVRHWDEAMRRLAKDLGIPKEEFNSDEQGFVDQYGQFLSRSEAYQVVVINKQQLNGKLEMEGYSELYSEHLY